MSKHTCKRCAAIDVGVERLRQKVIDAANRNSQSDQYELVAEVIRLTLEELGMGLKSDVAVKTSATPPVAALPQET